MPLLNQKQLAAIANIGQSTFCRKIAELMREGKFKKESSGYYYDEKEQKKLARLLNFTIEINQKKGS